MTSVRTAGAVDVRRALMVTVLVITAAWILLILFWDEAPFALTFDDAYYYFGIARNVADGHGSTFDQLNATNGYHPLWLALAVPFYTVGLDGMAAVRALMVFQMLMYCAGFLLVADSIGRAVGDWAAVRRRRGDDDARWCSIGLVLVFALIVANPFVVKVFVNGLESAVVLVVDAVLLWLVARGMPGAVVRWSDRSSRWRIGVGVVLAVAFLARTDAVLLVACLGLWVLFESWPLDRARFRGLVELFLPVGLTGAIYLLANKAAFDTPVQVSGLVKQAPLTAGRVLVGAGCSRSQHWCSSVASGVTHAPARRTRSAARCRVRSTGTGWVARRSLSC